MKKKYEKGYVIIDPKSKRIFWGWADDCKSGTIRYFIRSSVFNNWKQAYRAGYRIRRCKVIDG